MVHAAGEMPTAVVSHAPYVEFFPIAEVHGSDAPSPDQAADVVGEIVRAD